MSPSSTTPTFEKEKTDVWRWRRTTNVEDFGSGVCGAHPGRRPAEEMHACLDPGNR